MKNNFMLKTVRNFIGENDPPTFTLFNVNGKSPVLLVCDHASNIFPLSMGDFGLKQKDMRRHIAWDIGAKNVTQIISKKLDAFKKKKEFLFKKERFLPKIKHFFYKKN